jgi:uncharacterized protein (DUF2336 family)
VSEGQSQSLIIELEEALRSGSKDRRIDTLRRVTDLFVADAERLSDQQINVFDEVIGHLIKRIESRALTELGRRLAPIQNAPTEVVRQLARDDDIAVAQPILTVSGRLSESDLIEIASTKTQAHLLAISSRPQIGIAVTDVLLRRGNQDVFRTLADNSGAQFSVRGFEALVRSAEHDERLAEKIGVRLDVPLRLFRELLSRATEVVRTRLLELAAPESRRHIQGVLTAIAEDAQHEARYKSEHDYVAAQAHVAALRTTGQLDEGAVLAFASKGQYTYIVAALSALCGAPMPLVDELLQNKHREAILIACKAAELEWPTVRAVLNCRAIAGRMSDQDADGARTDFLRLSPGGAQRVLRFWQVRHAVANEPANPLATNGLRPLRRPPPSPARMPDDGSARFRSNER